MAFLVSSCAGTDDGIDSGFRKPPPSWPDGARGATRPTNDTHTRSDKQAGYDRFFKNANTRMWVPSNAVLVWDNNPTSGVHVSETSPPGASVKEFKISVYLKVSTQKTFEFYTNKFPEWDFQEHPTLSMRVKNGTTQMRKDLRDSQRGTVISILATVRPSSTADDDNKTARKMVESARLVQD